MGQITLWKPFQFFLLGISPSVVHFSVFVWLTAVKNKVNRPNACFTTLCQSTDFDDQSNLSPIVPYYSWVILLWRKEERRF
jgi:hypothetical protein